MTQSSPNQPSPRKHPSKWSLLNPQPGETIYLRAYWRVSTKKQRRNERVEGQLQRCRAAVGTLQRKHPDSTFILVDSDPCVVSRHDRVDSRAVQEAVRWSRQPNHYLIVADTTPTEGARRDISRLTRSVVKLKRMLDQGAKIITASNPYCRKSDLLFEAGLALREYNSNRRNRGYPLPAPRLPFPARKKLKSLRRHRNALIADRRWRRLSIVMSLNAYSCKSGTELARLMNRRGFKTPGGAKIGKMHVSRAIERDWFSKPDFWPSKKQKRQKKSKAA